jgi:opacity protein-like surface antigen
LGFSSTVRLDSMRRNARRLLAALAAACLSAAAYAADLGTIGMSAGLGFSASPYFYTETAKAESLETKSSFKTDFYTGFAYFDITYLQASLGFGMSSREVSKKIVDEIGLLEGQYLDAYYGDYYQMSFLSFCLLLKYPFRMEGFTVFPAIGIEYDRNLSFTNADGKNVKADMSGDEKDNLNMFWIKGGVGIDIPVFKEIYLRPEVLVAYKLHSKLERDRIESWKSSDLNIDTVSFTAYKVDIGLMVGYRF